jgi:hypothetical protein
MAGAVNSPAGKAFAQAENAFTFDAGAAVAQAWNHALNLVPALKELKEEWVMEVKQPGNVQIWTCTASYTFDGKEVCVVHSAQVKGDAKRSLELLNECETSSESEPKPSF